MPAGQIVGRLTAIRPVADLIADLVTELAQTPARLGNLAQ